MRYRISDLVRSALVVGQRIRTNAFNNSISASKGDNERVNGFTGTIVHVGDNYFWVKRDDGFSDTWSIRTYNAEAFIEFLDSSSDTSMPTTAANIMEFFNNLTATAEEKLLKKHGLEDPIGTPTSVGLSLSAQIQYKANRKEIIEIAKKMEAEATANAKTN